MLALILRGGIMIHTTFAFSLDPPERLSGRAMDRRQKELDGLMRPLAKKNVAGDWQIDLDSPKLSEIVGILQRLQKTKAAWMGFVEIDERFLDVAKTRAGWYVLEPHEQSHLDACFLRSVNEEQVYPFGNAAAAKPGMHVADWGPDSILVSERFKEAVVKHRLTGLEFLWVRDTGRYQALQWYLPLPCEILGRGLDHPWYDPAKSTGVGFAARDLRARHGQRIATSLGGFTLRSKSSFGDPVKDRLLKLAVAMSKGRMVVMSYPRYLRKYLPRTDFAATVRDRQYGDEIWRDRGLAVSRRARDVLLTNGLVPEKNFVAVKIFDRVPPGLENLDRLCGKPEPVFLPSELTRLRAQEATFWAEHVRHAKPPRPANLGRSLTLLHTAKRREPKDFPRPAAPKALAGAQRALGVQIPAAWQKVLRISNGGRIANSPLAAEQACLIVPVEKLPKAQREEVEYYRAINAPRPKSWLLVVQTEIGDSIWLDTRRKKTGGECRVVLVSHETGEEEREWPSVAEFLEELLTAEAD
jgi:hypothetical protein